MRKDGILLGRPTSVDMELTDAKEMVEALKKMSPGMHGRLLLDQRSASRKLSAEARAYMADHVDHFDKIAIVVASAISRFFASGVLMLIGRRRKVQVFESEASAVAWLLEGLSAAASR
jgi:hypothetical protein